MKMLISKMVFDENSSEQVELYVYDKYMGKYSFGIYSKWFLNRVNNGEGAVPDVGKYVAGLIYKNFAIDLREPGSFKLLSEKIENCDVGAWFEAYMEEELALNEALKIVDCWNMNCISM